MARATLKEHPNGVSVKADPYDDSGLVFCENHSPDRRYVCTRAPGHKGDHIAHEGMEDLKPQHWPTLGLWPQVPDMQDIPALEEWLTKEDVVTPVAAESE